MNNYQREVAHLDRRHHVRVRVLSFLAAAVLVIAALWAAGVPPSAWWARLVRRAAPEAPSFTAAEQLKASSPTALTPSVLPAEAPKVPAGTDSSLSARPQPLYLIATTPGRNAREGSAQIGTNPENPQTYAAGAVLANGARLSEVHRDHVVLTRGDASVKLHLFQRDPRATRPPDRSALLNIVSEPLVPKETAKVAGGLIDYLRPSPVYTGEILRGYVVYPGRKGAVFARLGLKGGDVITALDGATFTDPAQAMEMLQQLTRGAAMVANIERNGAPERITLDGSIITADQESADASAQLSGQTQTPQF